jgi:ABC-type Fe3+ transport system permease subunit
MDFGVPSALMVNAYPIEVLSRLGALQDVPQALGSAAVGLLLVAGVGVARVLFVRADPWPRGSDGPASASRGRGLTALALLVLVLTLVVPLASLVTRARGAYDEALRTAGEEVLTSLAVASGTALVLTLVGAAVAWAFVALGPRARAFGGMLVLATLVVPGAVVGLGLLTLVAGDVFPFGALRGSAALVGWGAAARFLALPVFLLGSFARAWPAALGAAAAVHGARRARILVRIVLPLALPLTLGAAALVFVLALGELPVAVLVAPPGEMTLAVRIESLLHFGKDELVAALCAVQVGLVLAVLGAARLLGEARGKDGRASRAP